MALVTALFTVLLALGLLASVAWPCLALQRRRERLRRRALAQYAELESLLREREVAGLDMTEERARRAAVRASLPPQP